MTKIEKKLLNYTDKGHILSAGEGALRASASNIGIHNVVINNILRRTDQHQHPHS
jgi:hypothetical protein